MGSEHAMISENHDLTQGHAILTLATAFPVLSALSESRLTLSLQRQLAVRNKTRQKYPRARMSPSCSRRRPPPTPAIANRDAAMSDVGRGTEHLTEAKRALVEKHLRRRFH